MTDIVERLRALEAWIRKPEGEQFTLNTDLFDDAADEIERLRAALRGVIRVADRDTAEFNEARAALEGK